MLQGDSSHLKSWFNVAANELEALQVALKELEKNLNCSDATLQLRSEVVNLKNKVSVYEMFKAGIFSQLY